MGRGDRKGGVAECSAAVRRGGGEEALPTAFHCPVPPTPPPRPSPHCQSDRPVMEVASAPSNPCTTRRCLPRYGPEHDSPAGFTRTASRPFSAVNRSCARRFAIPQSVTWRVLLRRRLRTAIRAVLAKLGS